MDTYGNMTPAALIPFCAYNSNMNITGKYITELSFPVCDKFRPTILDGQLCYTLNMDLVAPDTKTRPGKQHGIMIFIDSDNGRLENNLNLNIKSPEKGLIRLGMEQEDENSARIYISTLTGFTDYRDGSYALSALKMMEGTRGFLEQSDDIKQCQMEVFEVCQAKRYLEIVERECGCVPWTLTSALPQKVNYCSHH